MPDHVKRNHERQRNHDSTTAQAVANQIMFIVYSHYSTKKSEAQKKDGGPKLLRWSYLYPKVLFDFSLIIFLESYREIDTAKCKNTIIVTEKYV